MFETLHKQDSLLRRAANHFRMAMAATLALALGIGVNAAIFNLERLRYAGEINLRPFDLFSQSDSRPETAEAAASNDAERGQEHGALAGAGEDSLACAPAQARGGEPALELKGRALSHGGYLITMPLHRKRAGHAIAPEGR